MTDFSTMLEREKHLKIYYFFRYGEIIECFEENNPDNALEQFLEAYKPNDFDYLLEYDKKFGYYMTYRYDSLKRVRKLTPSLRHQK